MSRQAFRVRFKEPNGRDGGLGETKSFKTFARNSKDAAKKLRKKARIISVRRIP